MRRNPLSTKAISVACSFVLLLASSFLLIRNINSGVASRSMKEIHEEGEAMDNPIRRAEYEFNMLKNPTTGDIPEGVFTLEMLQAGEIFQNSPNFGTLANTYSFQGPNNKGGRTRAIAYDVRFNGTSNQVIISGGVSGGIYKSTDNGATWTRKGPTNQLYSVTAIAQDPRATFQDTWYYATGETIGNSASETGAFYCGNGIYKSIDNGETWTRLTGSNAGALENFDARQDLISSIVVNPTNGDIYFGGMDGVYRSQNGGTTWSNVLTSGANSISTAYLIDVKVTSTGILYAGVSGESPAVTLDMPGVWTSTTGNSGAWTKIAGDGAIGNPATWPADDDYGRVVLGIAPSNQNIVYVLYDNFGGYPQREADFFRYDASTLTWSDRSSTLPNEPGGSIGNDPFAVQGGYDMVITVKPDDPNTVFIGGTNVYRSTDGFASNGNTTRIGGYAGPSTYSLYTNSHPDIHGIVFQPGSTSIMLCANDGGIQRTANALASPVVWTDICTDGYRSYQYYYVTLDPRNGNGKVLGGAQDNGTTRNIGGTGSDFEMIYSGDGVSVGLSNVVGGNTFEYMGSQEGNIVRRNVTSGVINSIRPTGATDAGLFVTLFYLDPDNTENLYYASDSSLYRTNAASTVTTGGWTKMTGIQSAIVDGATPKTVISAMATTRGTYSAATASLFIGTNEGRIYRLNDPANAAAASVPVNISSGSFSSGGYVSSIAVNPRNDDTVLLTFSNYGITSVWWTGNANSATPTWLNVEGPVLTAPSYRSSAIAITNAGVEYFVGTSVGLYKASIDAASPSTTSWVQEGATEVGNAVVTGLVLRPADNRLLAGTHGVGMWATNLALAGLPVDFVSFTGKAEDRQNKLFWKVENEVGNKGYDIERKYSGENSYAKIGFVGSKTNNSRSNDYSFNDGKVDLGKQNASYRLKQIDIDGKFKYSSIVTLGRKVSPRFVEYVSANNNVITIRFNGENSQQKVALQLFDGTGRLLKESSIVFQTQQINIAYLPHGPLIVTIQHPDGRKFVQKIIH